MDFSLFVGKRLWDIPEIFHVQDLGSRHRIEHIFRIERRTQSLQHAMIKDVPLIRFTINIIPNASIFSNTLDFHKKSNHVLI